MLRMMKTGDRVIITLAGETHAFDPDRVRVAVVDTAPKGGRATRYAMLTIQLDDEFPEDLAQHLAHVQGG